MKIITFGIFICLFLFLRPYHIQDGTIMFQGDDRSYFAHASALVFGQFPSYEKEFFTAGELYPEHPIGCSLMASPFVFIFSLLDRWSGSDIVVARTAGNIASSWSVFGFIVATNFYFWMGCFLLFKGLSLRVPAKYAVWAVILMVLAQGVPLYAFQRPVFSHIYELFLQCWFMYCWFVSFQKEKERKLSYGGAALTGFMAGLMTLVRYNNLFMALLWPLMLAGRPKDILRNKGPVMLAYGVWALMLALFKILPQSIHHWEQWDIVRTRVLAGYPIDFYLRRIGHIFFGPDWGLLYTAPFLLAGFVYLFFMERKTRNSLLILLLPLLVNFFITIQWRTQGGWYGYRYILFLAIPILIYPLAMLLKFSYEKLGSKAYLISAFGAMFPVLSMICFAGNNSNLTLDVVEQYFGVMGWGNNTYQLEVWKTVFFHPAEFLIALLKGGPLYLVHLLSYIFQFQGALPAAVIEKYPSFQWDVLAKTSMLYGMPFILYFILCRRSKPEK